MLDILGDVPIGVYAALVGVLVIVTVGYLLYRTSWWQRRLMVRDNLMLNGAGDRLRNLEMENEELDVELREDQDVYAERMAKLLERKAELGIEELDRSIPKKKAKLQANAAEIKEINRAVARADRRNRRLTKKGTPHLVVNTKAVKRIPVEDEAPAQELSQRYDEVDDRPDMVPVEAETLTGRAMPPSELLGGSHNAYSGDDRVQRDLQG